MEFALGFAVGAVVAVTVPRFYKWVAKQIADARSHIPGA